MPRFLLVEGVPGLPVAHPASDDPKRFVGMRRRRAEGESVHTEDCFQEVLQEHPHLLDAVAKGELKLIGKVLAKDFPEARARLALLKPEAAKSAKGGVK